MDNNLITALVTTEVLARRTPEIDASARRQLSLRNLALVSAGLPPAVALVDTQSQVRRLERFSAPPVVAPGAGIGFQATGQRIAEELALASTAATSQIEAVEERISEADADLKAQKKSLELAKKQAEQLEECAVAVGEVFNKD